MVVGTRPNFVKVTRFREVARSAGIDLELLHTGQHSDDRMTRVFFEQFGLCPDHSLQIPDGSPASRIAHMILAMEPVLKASAPSAVMVVGDVDSTLAGAVVAVRNGFPLHHLESGLRSFDRSMPEEINRMMVDRIAQHHFITEKSALKNLRSEGIDERGIHFVGNTMIDALVKFNDRIEGSTIVEELGLRKKAYVLITMHRPATVDVEERSRELTRMIGKIASDMPVVFPIHPRTRRNFEEWGLLQEAARSPNVKLLDPLDHFSFQKLLTESFAVITDSGGVQEETTYRKVPCLTLRPGTERPVTVEIGSNRLTSIEECPGELEQLRTVPLDTAIPELWDGHATERVFEVLRHVL